MKRILLCAALAACGVDDDAKKPASVTTRSVSEPEGLPPAEENRDSRDGLDHALLVSDFSSLPACDATGEGRLVYVKADAGFVVCVTGAWEAIDLRGEKGDQGEAGKTGAQGETGEIPSQNTWRDPITDRLWLVGGTSTNANSCTGNGWRGPLFAELTAAAAHGMYAAFSSIATGTPYHCGVHTEGGAGRTEVKTDANCAVMAGPWGVYCILDEE